MRKRSFILPIAATILTGIFALSTYLVLNHVTKPGNIPPPATAFAPSPENLGAVLAIAQREKDPVMETTLRIPAGDFNHFWEHLKLAAAQEGWYTYRKPYRKNSMVLPAEDLPKLAALKADPLPWVLRRTASGNQPRGPSSLNLISVALVIDTGLPPPLWLAAIILLGFATLSSTIVAIVTIREALQQHSNPYGRKRRSSRA